MKKTEILNRVGGIINKSGLKLKKHSPEILIVAGVIGVVTSAVMACRATTKISEILDKTKEDVDKIHECMEDETLTETYTQEDAKKNLTIVYVQTGVKLVKLYAPSVILGAISIVSIVSSNNILRKRNIAITAAFAASTKSFKEYRNRVVDRFGKEVDTELKHNLKIKKVDEVVVDEDGKEKKVKKVLRVVDSDTCSEYARCFDSSCDAWDDNSDYNLMFLRSQQQFATDLLRTRKHLFLNEVYDMIGVKRAFPVGQVVGWVYNDENPIGDNYVDFGIHETVRETEDGFETVFLLDFNVDGSVLDLI